MRDLNWIKRANRKGAGPTGSREIAFDEPEPEKTTLLYKYTKEELRIPDTWLDHLKFDLRIWALVNHPGLIRRIVYWITRNYQVKKIPVVYEIHAAPKVKPKAGRLAK
jgi:hypothetical protein